MTSTVEERMNAPRQRRSVGNESSSKLRKAEARRQLLAQAKKLLAAQGLGQTSAAQIAAAAGFAEDVFHRHFKDAKAGLLAVLEEIHQSTIARWDNEVLTLSDPLAKLHALAELYLGAAHACDVEWRLVHRCLLESDDEEIRAGVRSLYLAVEGRLAALINEGQQAGLLRRNLDPRVGAWELIQTALGYSLLLPLNVPLYQESGYLAQAIDCVMQSLVKVDV